LNPPLTVLEMVELPELPCATESDEGDALSAKLGVVTVRVTVVVSVVPLEVPVTVMVYVPPLVPEGTFTVIADVSVPEIEVGLKLTVGPAGDTEPVSPIVPLNPPVGVKEMVELPELPGATESDEDEEERLKPGVVGPESASIRLAPLGLPQPVARS